MLTSPVVLFLAACCAVLLVVAPADAEVSPDGIGASLAKLGATFCELAGCTMTGPVELSNGGTTRGSLSAGASGTDPVFLRSATPTSGGFMANTGAAYAGRQADFGDDTPVFCAAENVDDSAPSQLVCVDGFGDLSNNGVNNSGRLTIDDDAEVTGSFTMSATSPVLTLGTGGALSSSNSSSNPVWVLANDTSGGGILVNDSVVYFGTQAASKADGAPVACVAGNVDGVSPTQSLCVDGNGDLYRTNADLRLETATSGDVVLAPASGLVQSGVSSGTAGHTVYSTDAATGFAFVAVGNDAEFSTHFAQLAIDGSDGAARLTLAPDTGGGAEIDVGGAASALTVTADLDVAGLLQLTATTSGTRPACADAVVGSVTLYDDGAGARTLCVCEETAADTFAWGAVTASGSC